MSIHIKPYKFKDGTTDDQKIECYLANLRMQLHGKNGIDAGLKVFVESVTHRPIENSHPNPMAYTR